MKKTIRVWQLKSGQPIEISPPFQQEKDHTNLDALSKLLPDGAYTTFRTYQGRRVIGLSAHFQRLRETAGLSGQELLINECRVREVLREILAGYTEQDFRIRVTLAFEGAPGDVYLALQELAPLPGECYRDGVRVVTYCLLREQPKAKRTAFIAEADLVRRSLPPEVEEAIMVHPAGELMEGLSSNFFGLLAGEIWTAEEGVLSGVTRRLTLDCAAKCGIKVHFQPVTTAQIGSLQEAFITSSSRGVLPVVRIDDVIIGDGRPGQLTQQLMECYSRLVESESEVI